MQRSFGPWGFGNGPLLYLERDALATMLSFAPTVLEGVALLGWAAALPRMRGVAQFEALPAVVLGAPGVACYGVYVLLAVPRRRRGATTW